MESVYFLKRGMRNERLDGLNQVLKSKKEAFFKWRAKNPKLDHFWRRKLEQELSLTFFVSNYLETVGLHKVFKALVLAFFSGLIKIAQESLIIIYDLLELPFPECHVSFSVQETNTWT